MLLFGWLISKTVAETLGGKGIKLRFFTLDKASYLFPRDLFKIRGKSSLLHKTCVHSSKIKHKANICALTTSSWSF